MNVKTDPVSDYNKDRCGKLDNEIKSILEIAEKTRDPHHRMNLMMRMKMLYKQLLDLAGDNINNYITMDIIEEKLGIDKKAKRI